MDAWHMVEKFRTEIVDSSSDDESDQSAHTLATTAASMIHEFTSNPGRSIGAREGALEKPAAQQSGGAGPPPQGLLPPHQSDLSGKIVPAAIQDVKGPVLGHSTGVGLRPLLPMQARCNRLMQVNTPRVSYEINGNAYDKPYYLADGIYPDWATLVKTVRNPNSEKTRRFAKMQELAGKMWSVDLVCSKLGGQLSVTRQEHGR
ncbi:hypothetical protein QYE76_020453 [Lolium multiflorum]|uniref:Uncharacterized protein n=1 Tax=Lolium multiflorum TaxID=4521 RepID=A0AAD8R6F5_LOLMU|nr:hypothetical protein QYE76_020453 [Lolium multiflorum]